MLEINVELEFLNVVKTLLLTNCGQIPDRTFCLTELSA